MRPILIAGLIALSAPMMAVAQDDSGKPVEVRKQTANTAPQKVVETPQTRKNAANQHLSDGLNTKKGSGDPRERDEFGTPRPESLKGQGTNSSSDAMRAADKKK